MPAAVVVTYGPGPAAVDLVRRLVGAGCRTLVVDNGTPDPRVVDECAEAGAEVHRLGSNRGVASAVNVGLAVVSGTEEWLFTFDQDSVVGEGYVDALVAAAAAASSGTAVVAPVVRDRATGRVLQGDPSWDGSRDVPRVITSGALCRVAALDSVGGLRDDLFIDYVDFDLCLRLRTAGWRVRVDPAAVLEHSIGQGSEHRVAGLRLRTSNHAADRQYYKYRNYLLLARAGTLRADPSWAARSAVALVWTALRMLLLEEDRTAKLRAVVAGVRDGVRGRGGPRTA